MDSEEGLGSVDSNIDGERIPEIKVLEHGFVRLVDVMGTDTSIVQAARTSTGKGSKGPESDAKLISYLMENRHETPFEFCQLVFHVKAPVYVERQLFRHRAASINSASMRYKQMDEEFDLPDPERFHKQSRRNKQGGEESIDVDIAKLTRARWLFEQREGYERYSSLISQGMAKEDARMNLPLRIYTEWYWSMNLRNVLHMLGLRLDKHAQYETRLYADAVSKFVLVHFPITWNAFLNYRLHAITFSLVTRHAYHGLLERVLETIQDGALPVEEDLESLHELKDRLEWRLS